MKAQIHKYLNQLFADVPDTKQLLELKEELGANLLEKVNDLRKDGDSEDTAFKKAIASLGDMSELAASLRKAAEAKTNDAMFRRLPVDKTHVIGYVAASAVVLFGIMAGGIAFLQKGDLYLGLRAVVPFILLSVPVFVYLGLTQETRQHYGMNHKRALSYSVATLIFLLGAVAAGIVYLQKQEYYVVFSTFMPSTIIAAVIFLYLGLTEKSRRKLDQRWKEHWIEYYGNPRTAVLRESISGALWIFAIAAFFLVAFIWGWKFSWIVFIAAIGLEVVVESVFAARKR